MVIVARGIAVVVAFSLIAAGYEFIDPITTLSLVASFAWAYLAVILGTLVAEHILRLYNRHLN